ncbi:hypothetical protein DFH06DRAFT_1193556 [Mycena polygramma]|nr:hypothetical protein DFH06DRAFT_1193556 [Mycena polygramma]
MATVGCFERAEEWMRRDGTPDRRRAGDVGSDGDGRVRRHGGRPLQKYEGHAVQRAIPPLRAGSGHSAGGRTAELSGCGCGCGCGCAGGVAPETRDTAAPLCRLSSSSPLSRFPRYTRTRAQADVARTGSSSRRGRRVLDHRVCSSFAVVVCTKLPQKWWRRKRGSACS